MTDELNITTDDLRAIATGTPVYTRTYDRAVTHYFYVPDTEPDYAGRRPTVRLHVEHNRAGFSADLQLTSFLIKDGWTSEAFSLRHRPFRLELAGESVPRFNRKRYDAFVAKVHADLGVEA